MSRLYLLLALVTLLSACRAELILPPTPTPDAGPPATAIAPAAPLPTAEPGTWQFREPRAQTTSALLEGAEGFALNPTWRIASVEYVYQWWGLSPNSELSSQMVRRDGDGFIREGTPITLEAMTAFADSVARFQPSQTYVYGNAWTDDYPTHTVEVIGEDNQRLLFSSTSTGNPGDGPWNLIYNDRLYAQYDGALGYGLEGIFTYEMRGTGADLWGDTDSANEDSHVSFETSALPLQLQYGFEGLLPIADRFVYHADSADGQIKGEIVGRSSIGGWGNMVIGTFTELTSVRVGEVHCAITPVDIDDVVGAAWRFTCAMNSPAEGEAFLYPITVDLVNDRGKSLQLTGNLAGVWNAAPRPLRLPLPPFLHDAFAQNEEVMTLLARHEHAEAQYSTTLEGEWPHKVISLSGNLTLYGNTTMNGEPVRYQVTTPFALNAAQTLTWEMTPGDLDLLISDTLALPETIALLGNYPDITLQLGYFAPMGDAYHYLVDYPIGFATAYAAECPVDEERDTRTESVLRRVVGYHWNDGSGFIYGGIDEQRDFRASYSSLWLSEDSPLIYFPDITEPLNEGYIFVNRSGRWNSFSFGFDRERVTPEKIARFEGLAEQLGAELNHSDATAEEYPEWWAPQAYAIEVMENGDIQLVRCN